MGIKDNLTERAENLIDARMIQTIWADEMIVSF